MIKIIFNFLFLLAFSTLLHAGDGDKKIRLMGKVREGVPKHLSVKALTKGLNFVEENIYNPYEKRSDLYGGVLLDEFVKKYASPDVKEIRLIAIDDYEVIIPKSEWNSKRIILSTHINRKFIPITSKGPLYVVFPDYDPKLKEYQVNLPMWIWMITKIEFR